MRAKQREPAPTSRGEESPAAAGHKRAVKFDTGQNRSGPVVSVILPTYNRPAELAQALAGAVGQDYRNLQIIVVNDGGRDVRSVVESFADPRIVFINRRQNLGKASSLNEALTRATGKYIAYLDDDDIYYPNHIATLVEALENDTNYGVAYTDLYKTYCRVAPDGRRTALSKVVEVSRDFDRFVMLYFNHVLHVSTAHRRDLLDKTGLYNENLDVLIDWDMTRRLAFFTDFIHIPQITGEYYLQEGSDDRISVRQRKDKQEYCRNALTIRTTRPAKPWPKLADLSIILTAERLNRQISQTIGLIWRWTFYPYKLYLTLSSEDSARFRTDMPNVVVAVPASPAKRGEPATAKPLERIDKALADCEGDYVAVVPADFPIRDMWVEDSLYALLNAPDENEAFELEGSTPDCWAVVARKGHLQRARSKFPQLPLDRGLAASGISVRRVRPDEIPFQFDTLLKKAQGEMKNGNFREAARIYEGIAGQYHNQIWMKTMAAEALFDAGDFADAGARLGWLHRHGPTPATLLLEAKIRRHNGDFKGAIELLEKAKGILTQTNCGFQIADCGLQTANY